MKNAKLMAATLLVGASTAAQTAEMPGHVRLRTQPALAQYVAALPRVVPNEAVSAEIADKLNARFARMDADQRALVRECHAAERKMHGDPGSYAVSVKVTMRGPRFLSLMTEEGGDCGGAHPDGSTAGLVYDVTTGAPVDWLALLPGAKAGYKARDGSGGMWVISHPLLEATRKAAEAECREIFTDPEQQFTVWLDGDLGALMAAPAGLAHIDAATCGGPVALDLATLRGLRVSADVVQALDAALHEPGAMAAKRREAAQHQTP